MKTNKYAEVSTNGTSFVLQATTKPIKNGNGGRSAKFKYELARGSSPRLLAEQAVKDGYTLFSVPTANSRYAMKGKDVADWNGQIVGQYPEAMTPNKL
jgi:hypothetical protein